MQNICLNHYDLLSNHLLSVAQQINKYTWTVKLTVWGKSFWIFSNYTDMGLSLPILNCMHSSQVPVWK